MRVLLVASLLASPAALGATLNLLVQERTAITVGPSQCAVDLSLTWTVTNTTGQACEPLKLWVTTASACESAPDASQHLVLTEVPTSQVLNPSGTTRTIPVEDLPAFSKNSTTCGSTAALEQVHRVCGVSKLFDSFGACNNAVTISSAPTVTYDSKPPNAPSISEVSPRDSALAVTVGGLTSDTTLVRVLARRAAGAVVEGSAEGASDQGTYVVTGLENGVTYQLTAVAEDGAGNVSAESTATEGTPVKTRGFYELYLAANGGETGGCAAGGGAAGGLVTVGLWLFARRRRSWLEQ